MLIEFNWRPERRQLRQFGLICLIALPLVAGLWSHWYWPAVAVSAGVGALLALLGLVFPPALKPVYLALSLVATPIGIVIGELALLLVFFGVFLPIGIVFRLMGRDVLQKKFDHSAKTYFQPKNKAESAARYYRQS